VVHLGLAGDEVATYVFKNMDLHKVAVTPDERRLIGVGTLMSSPSGLTPRVSKEERRIAGTCPPPPISCCIYLNNNLSLQHQGTGG